MSKLQLNIYQRYRTCYRYSKIFGCWITGFLGLHLLAFGSLESLIKNNCSRWCWSCRLLEFGTCRTKCLKYRCFLLVVEEVQCLSFVYRSLKMIVYSYLIFSDWFDLAWQLAFCAKPKLIPTFDLSGHQQKPPSIYYQPLLTEP